MSNEDKIAALEREIAAQRSEIEKLKAKDKPPAPVKSDWVYVNPIDRLSMPPSAMQAMVQAEPAGFMQGVVRDSHAPQGPSGDGTGKVPGGVARGVAGDGRGWAIQRDWGDSGQHPVPGVAAADRIADAFAARDRAELEKGRR
jgi:hypothetical protein